MCQAFYGRRPGPSVASQTTGAGTLELRDLKGRTQSGARPTLTSMVAGVSVTRTAAWPGFTRRVCTKESINGPRYPHCCTQVGLRV
jgi:hypothetical protein